MRIVTKRLIFSDGSIGYTQGPEFIENEVQKDDAQLVYEEEIQADHKQLHKLIDESKDKIAEPDGSGRWVIKDKKPK